MTHHDFMRDVATITARMLHVAEACASVSLSHPPTCPCMVCSAADGDVEALAIIVDMLDRRGNA